MLVITKNVIFLLHYKWNEETKSSDAEDVKFGVLSNKTNV